MYWESTSKQSPGCNWVRVELMGSLVHGPPYVNELLGSLQRNMKAPLT